MFSFGPLWNFCNLFKAKNLDFNLSLSLNNLRALCNNLYNLLSLTCDCIICESKKNSIITMSC